MIKPLHRKPGRVHQRVLRGLIVVAVVSVAYFLYGFFTADAAGNPWLFGMLAFILVFSMIKKLSQWWYYLRIETPVEPPLTERITVDVLTTFYPGEPRDMVKRTLLAITRLNHPHTAYLCDEANDPELKAYCQLHGVVHVTRDNFVDAKAGNINNALKQAKGEICVILDPDHIPNPDFLDRVVPYFQDPGIGFVQVVQAYYNKKASLVAKGAAQQTFHFYGPIMMGMNGYGTVDAIGANCTFRRSALDGIGGHAPGLAEDMHTCMLLYAKGWRSVYVPQLVAEGLSPATLTAYYKQQLKWSRGTFDLLFKVYPRIFSSLTWPQRFHFPLKSIHYLFGLVHLVGFFIPILSLFLSDTPWLGDFLDFLLLATPVLASTFVIRFYVQQWLIADDERGFHLVGGILEIVTWWVYTVGFLYALINRKVPYLPTPKEEEDVTPISLLLPNLGVGVLSIVAVGYGLTRDLTPYSIVMAVFALFNAFLMFTSVYLALGATNRTSFIRGGFAEGTVSVGGAIFNVVLWLLNAMTIAIRRTAPILLISTVALSVFLLWGNHHYNFAAAGEAAADSLAPLKLPPHPENSQAGSACPGQAYARLTSLGTTDALVGVDYLKVTDWQTNGYGMTRSNMSVDFATMKQAGVDLIRTIRPGVYRRNLLALADEFDLKVVFAFQQPSYTLGEVNAQSFKEWRKEVLQAVADLKDEPSIIAWEIHTLPVNNSTNQYKNPSRPKSPAEKDSSVKGLYRDVQDKVRSTSQLVSLITCDSNSSIFTTVNSYRIYGNWQDVWQEDQLTLDGFLDANGGKKTAYRELVVAAGQPYPGPYLPAVNILPTASPLNPGQTTRYTAQIEQDNLWLAADGYPHYALEWRIIKLDVWEKPIASRVVGNEPTLTLEVPEDYDRYRIGLTLSYEGYARSVWRPLNVPLYGAD